MRKRKGWRAIHPDGFSYYEGFSAPFAAYLRRQDYWRNAKWQRVIRYTWD